MYDLFLRSVRETLLGFSQDPKHGIGGKIGVICILLTWTQRMTYHPHVYCIVPAGVLTRDRAWKHAKSKGYFLFPVWPLSRLFRGKLMAGLHEMKKADKLKMTSPMIQPKILLTKITIAIATYHCIFFG